MDIGRLIESVEDGIKNMRLLAEELKRERMAKSLPLIPPLPNHPRFKNQNDNKPLFDTQRDCIPGAAVTHFLRIEDQLTLAELEACCAIARCWWFGQAADNENNTAYIVAHENAKAWARYYAARVKQCQ